MTLSNVSWTAVWILTCVAAACPCAAAMQAASGSPPSGATLTMAQASAFARLALRCVTKEYPNKPDHVINDAADVRRPKSMHPAFYGCFDWHSSVHGHWMLVRLLRLFPDLPETSEIRIALNGNLTRDNLRTEVDYLDQPNRQSFERTYGWAWLLKLAEELQSWEDADARIWRDALGYHSPSKNVPPDLDDQNPLVGGQDLIIGLFRIQAPAR